MNLKRETMKNLTLEEFKKIHEEWKSTGPENVVSTSNKGMSRIILWVSLFIIDTHHFFKDKTKEVMQGVLDLYLLRKHSANPVFPPLKVLLSFA